MALQRRTTKRSSFCRPRARASWKSTRRIAPYQESSRAWSSSLSLSPKTGGECGRGGAASPASSGGCSSYRSARTWPTAGSGNSMSIHSRCDCWCFLRDSLTPPTCRTVNTTRPPWSELTRSQCACAWHGSSHVRGKRRAAYKHVLGAAAEAPSLGVSSSVPVAASAQPPPLRRPRRDRRRATHQTEQDAGAERCYLEEARALQSNVLRLSSAPR